MTDTTLMTDKERFAEWVETFEQPFPTPYLESIFGPPRWARETLTERIEPYYSQFHQVVRDHPLYGSDGHDTEPDPAWYTPTPKLLALDEKLAALRAKAFREVPNPEYDPVRATAWYERQRSRVDQVKHEWGQAYSPMDSTEEGAG